MNDNEAIRQIIQSRIEAMARKDAAAAVAVLDDGIVAFELAGPLQVSAAAARDVAVTQAWLDSFVEGPHATLLDVAIHTDGEVAFCHSLNRLTGKRSDGQAVDVTMRSTLGFRKRNGTWKIVHGHTSLPR